MLLLCRAFALALAVLVLPPAAFASDPVLTVAPSGAGSGTVHVEPSGTDCTDTCSAAFPLGTRVVLTATPGPRSAHLGWSGDCDRYDTATCTVVMDGDRSASPYFTPLETLTVTRTGSGEGRVTGPRSGIDCGTACTADVPRGTMVELTAEPARGSQFIGWSGACSTTAYTCAVTVNDARTATATFARIRQLTFQVVGQGSITSPGVLGCQSVCTLGVVDGQVLHLDAAPIGTAAFVGWGGACAGAVPACDLPVQRDEVITARFASPSFPPPAGPLHLSLKASGSTRSALRRHGLPVTVKCERACRADMTLVSRGRNVARRSVTLSAGHGRRVPLRLTKAGRRVIAVTRRLTLRTSAVDAAGMRAVATRKIAVRG